MVQHDQTTDRMRISPDPKRAISSRCQSRVFADHHGPSIAYHTCTAHSVSSSYMIQTLSRSAFLSPEPRPAMPLVLLNRSFFQRGQRSLDWSPRHDGAGLHRDWICTGVLHQRSLLGATLLSVGHLDHGRSVEI